MRIQFHWFAIVWVMLAASARGEVWYERKLSESEKSRYTTAYSEWGIGESEEKLRKEWQGHEWSRSRNTIKVELLYDQSSKPPQPFIRQTVLGTDQVKLAVIRKWRKETGPRLIEGIEIPGMKGGPAQVLLAGRYSLYRKIDGGDIDCIGCVSREFRGPGHKTVRVAVYEVVGKLPEQGELLHDFLRNTILGEHKPIKTDFGTIISTETKEGKAKGYSYVQWIAAPYFITINAHHADAMEAARIFGKKFPSSLPADLKIDNKTAWGREEFELALRRAESRLKAEPWTAPTLPFEWGTEYVYCPIEWRSKLGNEYHEAREVRIAKNRKVFQELEAWWKQNKDKTYWDEKLNMLVAKGQTPVDVQAEADKLAKQAAKVAQQKQDAFLAKPMTEAEIAQATAKLLAQFEAKAKADKWRKVKDGEWLHDEDYSATGGEHYITTYAGPTVTPTKNPKTPLKGVFIKRWKQLGLELSKRDPRVKNGAIQVELEYRYYHLEDTWRERDWRKP